MSQTVIIADLPVKTAHRLARIMHPPRLPNESNRGQFHKLVFFYFPPLEWLTKAIFDEKRLKIAILGLF